MVYASNATSRHWLTVAAHYLIDVSLYGLAFVIAIRVRFIGTDEWLHLPNFLWPGIALGSLAFATATYIGGFYSPMHRGGSRFRLGFILLICHILALLFMVGIFYLNFSTRIGRGIMAIAAPTAILLSMLHHFAFGFWRTTARDRVLLVVRNRQEATEADLLEVLSQKYLDFVGIVTHGDLELEDARVLGNTSNLASLCRYHRIDRVICSPTAITDSSLYKPFLKLRYSGVEVIPIVALCEEAYQYIPVELITPDWLIGASSSPHMLYIKKFKRAFDIVTSLGGLMVFSPLLLGGMLAIRLTSRGPVFFRQVRCGRFGREFTVIKLRTMGLDAEKNGAVWAEKNDPRTTFVGHYLRKYRIDEIPQLLNVLRGEMSFVGPRPERPEFVDKLADQIPYYHERHLVQPGVTGWAQVSYPYGSSVEDARRKLEYDIYYMKHMSILLDIFILFDTVRIVLVGGLSDSHQKTLPDSTQTIRIARDLLSNPENDENPPTASGTKRINNAV